MQSHLSRKFFTYYLASISRHSTHITCHDYSRYLTFTRNRYKMLKHRTICNVSAFYIKQRYLRGQNMVGRKEEQRLLQDLALSEEPEFVVIYGRRRVGKTFLVRETYGVKPGKYAGLVQSEVNMDELLG